MFDDTLFMMGVGDSSLSPLVLKLETDDPTDFGVSASGLERLVSILSIFGLSDSSLRKLDLRRRVRSATDGGFSGRGGAGPLLPTVTGVDPPLPFAFAMFPKNNEINVIQHTKSKSHCFKITHLALKLPE